MENHFYGAATNEHYEKETKNFRPIDWITVCAYFGIAIGAVVAGFMGHWGVMIMIIGLLACLSPVLLRIVFGAKSKYLLIFVLLGIAAIIAGIIVENELWDALQYLILIAFTLISFSVTVICFIIKGKESSKMRKYSQSVEAVCEMVDVRRLNLFAYDDIIHNYTSPANANTIYKPGFRYVVNGTEYFTESTVYYGDLNTGFREGNKVLLKVNPENPNEIQPADKTVGNMALVMGICWIFGGITGIVLLILTINGVVSFY